MPGKASKLPKGLFSSGFLVIAGMGSPALAQRVKLKGGEMEFLVSRLDANTETVDLTPLESGFGVARNIHLTDIVDALTGNAFTTSSVKNPL